MVKMRLQCENCGGIFSPIDIGVGSNPTFKGCKTNCPFCNSIESIPDGTFKATFDGIVRILEVSETPLRDARELLQALKRSKNEEDLRKINQFFPNINYEYPLNPSYEPRERDSIKENAEIFRILQRYNRLNLLVPVNCEHMYDAAIESKTCKLTPLGVHYWNLVENKRI